MMVFVCLRCWVAALLGGCAVGNLLMFSNAGFKLYLRWLNHIIMAVMTYLRKEQRHLHTHWFF